MSGRSGEVVYFDAEGRDNYAAVLEIVKKRCGAGGVDKLVVFSASDDGALEAATQLPQVTVGCGLTVVTYRAEMHEYKETDEGLVGKPIGLTAIGERALSDRGVDVVRAAMPLSSEVVVLRYGDPKLSGIREALRMLGGGLVLVVQAILMACDAGKVREGQQVVAFAADTAIVATAAHSDSMFFPDVGMEISEILCKPGKLTITRCREEHEPAAEELPLS